MFFVPPPQDYTKIQQEYDGIWKNLDTFIKTDNATFGGWTSSREWITVDGNEERNIQHRLDINPLEYDEKVQKRKLQCKFDKDIMKLIHEMKYWEKLKIPTGLPQAANQLASQREQYRIPREYILLIVRMFNDISESISPKDRNVFQYHFEELNKTIEHGVHKMSWYTHDELKYEQFKDKCLLACKNMYRIVEVYKTNEKEIKDIFEKIKTTILVDIDKKDPHPLDEFMSRQRQYKDKKQSEFKRYAETIKEKLMEIYHYFLECPSPIQSHFLSFINGLDHELQESLTNAVSSTLQDVSRTITDDNKNEPVAIIILNSEINLDMTDLPVIFEPSYEELKFEIDSLITDINSVTKVIPRLEKTFREERDKLIKEKIRKEKEAEDSKQQTLAGVAIGGAGGGPRAGAKRGTMLYAGGPGQKIIDEEPYCIKEPYVEKKTFFKEIPNDRKVTEQSKKIRRAVSQIEEALDNRRKQMKTHHFKELINTASRTAKGKNRLLKITTGSDPATKFNNAIEHVKNICSDTLDDIDIKTEKFIRIDSSRLKNKLKNFAEDCVRELLQILLNESQTELLSLYKLMEDTISTLKDPPRNLQALKKNMTEYRNVQSQLSELEGKIGPIELRFNYLKEKEFSYPEEEEMDEKISKLRGEWETFQTALEDAYTTVLMKWHAKMKADMETSLEEFQREIEEAKRNFEKISPKSVDRTNMSTAKAKLIIQENKELTKNFREREEDNKFGLTIFEIDAKTYTDLIIMEKELNYLSAIWDLKEKWDGYYNAWSVQAFRVLDIDSMTDNTIDLIDELHVIGKDIQDWPIYEQMERSMKEFKMVMPIIENISIDAMIDRHWTQLKSRVKDEFDPDSSEFTLDVIITKLDLLRHEDFIADLAVEAIRDKNLDNDLKKIEHNWNRLTIKIQKVKCKNMDGEFYKIFGCDELFKVLEEDIAKLSSMKSSASFGAFEEAINSWETSLATISDSLEMLLQVQKQWTQLESIVQLQGMGAQLQAEKAAFERNHAQFKKELDRIFENNNAKDSCTNAGFLQMLTTLNMAFEKIQKSLNLHLEKKRSRFARFYFISNEDLLEILGNAQTPDLIARHFIKIFQGVHSLRTHVIPNKHGPKQLEITHIRSPDGEELALNPKIGLSTGPPEEWMMHLETKMCETLKRELKQVIDNKDIFKNPENCKVGQLLLTCSQINWTSEIQSDLESETTLILLQKHNKEHMNLLNQITKKVRTNLIPKERLKIVALITIEMHQKEIREQFIRERVIQSKHSFQWQKQLRFYRDGEATDQTLQLVHAEQTNSKIEFGYEYQGNNERLVITPLTDRCYLTLTTALFLKRGGAPQGPAGTGKTETVKDLGKALAKFVLVFNCSDSLDEKSLARMFRGICQTGSWGCFDEFNRIDIEVLSAVASQISTILDAIRAGLPNFNFERAAQIPLHHACGIFITMNPGYAGRNELPDNLKTLFRPFAMIVPDFQIIAEIILMAEGFSSIKQKDGAGEPHKDLAKKVVTIYDTMKQQLSKQSHYDFGLRARKSVLTFSGGLRRERAAAQKGKDKEKGVIIDTVEEEIAIMMQAISDMNMPKLVAQDIPLFIALLRALFPRTDLPEPDNDPLVYAIEDTMKSHGLQLSPVTVTVEKILQLYDSMHTRHGNMIVGQTLAGKTTCWKVLSESQTNLFEKNKSLPPQAVKEKDKQLPVKCQTINPKSIFVDELFGFYYADEWKDGILSSVLKGACEDTKDELNWIIMDGPVDTTWIESMNSLLDDNKVLTLSNGDRIGLTSGVSLLFEVEDLSVASLATVSRVGMVYLDVVEVGWKPVMDSWIQTHSPECQPYLDQYVGKWIDKCLRIKRTQCDELVPHSEIASVISLGYLFDACVPPKKDDTEDEISVNYWAVYEKYFVFALAWSIGATVVEESRKHMELIMRDIDSIFPAMGTAYDYFIDSKGEWANWSEKIIDSYKIEPDTPFHEIQVPTIDLERNKAVLKHLYKKKKNILVVGHTGVGKTALVQQILKGDVNSAEYNYFVINFSAQTTASKTQEIIEGKFEKRTKYKYNPRFGKKAICFVDDLNMPRKDTYGSQPALELLRQFLDYGGWYDRGKQAFNYIMDMQLITAMGPPGGGRAYISQRFQSKFHLINFTVPKERQIIKIFTKIGEKLLLTFEDGEIKTLGEQLARATYIIYLETQNNFRPTPRNCHYVFNMRDMSKVFQGVHRADKNDYESKEAILKLWSHEILRVFHDRLSTSQDQEEFVENILKKEVEDRFTPFSYDDMRTKIHTKPTEKEKFRDSIFVDFLSYSNYYNEAKDFKELKEHLESKMEDYNAQERKFRVNLVFFEDAISHLCRIYRILRLSRGNALLVGVGGSGRHCLTRLGAFLADMNIFQLAITRDFSESAFRDSIKEIYNKVGIKTTKKMKRGVFIFSDTEIIYESFLEDVNNILSSGEVPNLYNVEEFQKIKDRQSKDFKAEHPGVQETFESAYDFFISRVRDNLHVALCMSPIGATFRDYVRMYPAIVNNTTIDWFMKWPEVAMMNVAKRFVAENLNYSEDMNAKLAETFAFMHETVYQASQLMQQQIKRIYYVTPTNFMELMQGYIRILNEKTKEYGEYITKLQNGQSKLVDAQIQVTKMTEDSELKKQEMSKKTKEAEELMRKVNEEQLKADAQLEVINEKKAIIAKEREESDRIFQEAEYELNKALPALESAMQALENLDNRDIAEVKQYQRPPKDIEIVMYGVMVTLGEHPTWANVKKVMSDVDFKKRLVELGKKPESISTKRLNAIEKFTGMPSYSPAIIQAQSKAAGTLCSWVKSMEDYVKAYRTVEPKRRKVEETKKQLQKLEEYLKELEDAFKIVTDSIATLQAQHTKVKDELDSFQRQVKELQDKIERGERMISSLTGEKHRWERNISTKKLQVDKLPGDCLLSAAYMSYYGPFTNIYRKDLATKWLEKVTDFEIPKSFDYNFVNFMIGEAKVREWHMQKLPTDEFSGENSILVTKGSRWPLMIDPQNQAQNWIRDIEAKKLIVAKKNSRTYLSDIKKGVKYGRPVLLPDLGESMDPDLEGVLNKVLQRKPNGGMFLKVGKDEIDYNPNFKFYMTTNLNNPHYTPEVTTKVTLVNFEVKEQGLEEQLLDIVFQEEEPTYDSTKTELVIKIARSEAELIKLQDEILELLKESHIPLLEDIDLMDALSKSKETADDIQTQLEVSNQNMTKIKDSREKYRKAAKLGSILFFVVNELSKIDPMYQFSLEWYLNLFRTSIRESKTAPAVESIELRVESIFKYHKLEVYKNACNSLFEKHKLLLALQMNVRLAEWSDSQKEEWNFFLRGGQIMEKKDQPPNPAPDWITSTAWDNLTTLESLPNFMGIVAALQYNSKEWKRWYIQYQPEVSPLPGEWESKCDQTIKKMLVLRCLRPDRISFAATKLVIETLGQPFIDYSSRPVTLEDVYDEKVEYKNIPIVFILSQGVDPIEMLRTFAKKKDKDLKTISLGQGQTEYATKILEEGCQKGNWVFFANCHLAISWLSKLETLIEKLPSKKPHDGFRLFLSSSPTPQFPIFILQRSIKMTTEAPTGLKANILRLYSTMEDRVDFNSMNERNRFARLLFALTWFHSLLIERKKFKSLGWNSAYDFSDSDFLVCKDLIGYYSLDKTVDINNKDVPWEAIRELFADCNYGGRVTDELDARLLRTYAKDFFGPAVIMVSGWKPQIKGEFMEAIEEGYQCPDTGKDKGIEDGEPRLHPDYFYEEINANFPPVDAPEPFGQHVNAEISSRISDANYLMDCFITLLPSATSQGDVSIEASVKITLDGIVENLPEVVDVEAIKVKLKSRSTGPLEVVLIQELQRYNALLKIVSQDLKDLDDGIKGQVVITKEIEATMDSIHANKVPLKWLSVYQSVKSLARWTRDLIRRVEFFSMWSTKGQPTVFNISLFTYPTGFTTSLLQKFSKRWSVSIDVLLLEYIIMTDKHPNDHASQGGYVTGLYLEGAAWDHDRSQLDEPEPMQLNIPMPVIHFKPVQGKKRKDAQRRDRDIFYDCPCYYYPIRCCNIYIYIYIYI